MNQELMSRGRLQSSAEGSLASAHAAGLYVGFSLRKSG
jgi:hypothetical protein